MRWSIGGLAGLPLPCAGGGGVPHLASHLATSSCGLPPNPTACLACSYDLMRALQLGITFSIAQAGLVSVRALDRNHTCCPCHAAGLSPIGLHS